MNRANLILGTGWYRKKVLYIQLGADIVGSIAYSYEEGGFRELKGDFTRADARLDISSLVSPKINLAFQKQIIGLILFRLDSPSKEYLAHMEDVAMEEKFCFGMCQEEEKQ
eukprot:TRINITY_DN9863_c1_g1_i16.p1 TRINITY_DN9863_c1_g1~~TRINITY_DN9863_c1_g1_i16.p1  ORF type:complete len:111 (-),score=15.66 TRINITY_DN9863_c1_g1_i16:20-352(-)